MNTENNIITPFLFGESLIRTELRTDGPWFVIADVCTVFEHTNPSMIIARLHQDDLSTTEVIDSLGRKQTMNICNESGLYCLVFQSRKPVAKEFTRWVTSEVLPAIRRTGSYSPAHQAYLGLLREQIALGVPAALAARAAIRLTPPLAGIPRVPRPAAAPADDERSAVLQLLRSQMQPGRYYGVEELAYLLPETHPLRPKGTAPKRKTSHGRKLPSLDMSIAATLGKHLAWAVRENLLEKQPRSRHASYQLPRIVPITAEQS